MKWTHIRRMAISLPLAMLAAIAMVAINEVGYQRSNQALDAMVHAQKNRNAINHMMQNMLDAETGLRGYLLTSDERYLEPYNKAIALINGDMDQLRELFITSPDDLSTFAPLSRQVSRKTAEMELSLRLFREGNEEAWRFVMFTDMGKQNMDAIRGYTQQLIARSGARAEAKRIDVEKALWISRLGIATVTAIGLLAFYMYLRQSHTLEAVHKREQKIQSEERSRLEDLVRERTATLTELANHLQQVREDERGHLARELHDELGSLLTAAKLDVARLKSRIDMTVPEVADRIMHLTETLNCGIALKRRIIEDLRPSSLSNLGLTTSLEILTREFAQRSNIEVESSLEQVELPDATQLTVYRIIQESLTNIGKYANATRTVVSVHNYPTYVAVQIQDNGNGFDLRSIRPKSHGLAGMRHRVEAAGGRLTITSSLGEGTTISAVIPSAQSSLAA
ncbi:CHASE3 domain-containing protein [Comamonas sp. GB3 AK4-5]|uniref:CHASE3 domain-containing protein n=1 Tax=Comamonas sp. GB3 AK4-5 TaxID=3231487 RepID=UPI00351DFF1D